MGEGRRHNCAVMPYYNLRRISLVNGGLPPLAYRQQYLERTGAA